MFAAGSVEDFALTDENNALLEYMSTLLRDSNARDDKTEEATLCFYTIMVEWGSLLFLHRFSLFKIFLLQVRRRRVQWTFHFSLNCILRVVRQWTIDYALHHQQQQCMHDTSVVRSDTLLQALILATHEIWTVVLTSMRFADAFHISLEILYETMPWLTTHVPFNHNEETLSLDNSQPEFEAMRTILALISFWEDDKDDKDEVIALCMELQRNMVNDKDDDIFHINIRSSNGSSIAGLSASQFRESLFLLALDLITYYSQFITEIQEIKIMSDTSFQLQKKSWKLFQLLLTDTSANTISFQRSFCAFVLSIAIKPHSTPKTEHIQLSVNLLCYYLSNDSAKDIQRNMYMILAGWLNYIPRRPPLLDLLVTYPHLFSQIVFYGTYNNDETIRKSAVVVSQEIISHTLLNKTMSFDMSIPHLATLFCISHDRADLFQDLIHLVESHNALQLDISSFAIVMAGILSVHIGIRMSSLQSLLDKNFVTVPSSYNTDESKSLQDFLGYATIFDHTFRSKMQADLDTKLIRIQCNNYTQHDILLLIRSIKSYSATLEIIEQLKFLSLLIDDPVLRTIALEHGLLDFVLARIKSCSPDISEEYILSLVTIIHLFIRCEQGAQQIICTNVFTLRHIISFVLHDNSYIRYEVCCIISLSLLVMNNSPLKPFECNTTRPPIDGSRDSDSFLVGNQPVQTVNMYQLLSVVADAYHIYVDTDMNIVNFVYNNDGYIPDFNNMATIISFICLYRDIPENCDFFNHNHDGAADYINLYTGLLQQILQSKSHKTCLWNIERLRFNCVAEADYQRISDDLLDNLVIRFLMVEPGDDGDCQVLCTLLHFLANCVRRGNISSSLMISISTAMVSMLLPYAYKVISINMQIGTNVDTNLDRDTNMTFFVNRSMRNPMLLAIWTLLESWITHASPLYVASVVKGTVLSECCVFILNDVLQSYDRWVPTHLVQLNASVLLLTTVRCCEAYTYRQIERYIALLVNSIDMMQAVPYRLNFDNNLTFSVGCVQLLRNYALTLSSIGAAIVYLPPWEDDVKAVHDSGRTIAPGRPLGWSELWLVQGSLRWLHWLLGSSFAELRSAAWQILAPLILLEGSARPIGETLPGIISVAVGDALSIQRPLLVRRAALLTLCSVLSNPHLSTVTSSSLRDIFQSDEEILTPSADLSTNTEFKKQQLVSYLRDTGLFKNFDDLFNGNADNVLYWATLSEFLLSLNNFLGNSNTQEYCVLSSGEVWANILKGVCYSPMNLPSPTVSTSLLVQSSIANTRSLTSCNLLRLLTSVNTYSFGVLYRIDTILAPKLVDMLHYVARYDDITRNTKAASLLLPLMSTLSALLSQILFPLHQTSSISLQQFSTCGVQLTKLVRKGLDSCVTESLMLLCQVIMLMANNHDYFGVQSLWMSREGADLARQVLSLGIAASSSLTTATPASFSISQLAKTALAGLVEVCDLTKEGFSDECFNLCLNSLRHLLDAGNQEAKQFDLTYAVGCDTALLDRLVLNHTDSLEKHLSMIVSVSADLLFTKTPELCLAAARVLERLSYSIPNIATMSITLYPASTPNSQKRVVPLVHGVVTLLLKDSSNIALLSTFQPLIAFLEARNTIAKSGLLASLRDTLLLKMKQRQFDGVEARLKILLFITAYRDGAIHVSKLQNAIALLVDFLQSKLLSIQIAALCILRNLVSFKETRIRVLSDENLVRTLQVCLESDNYIVIYHALSVMWLLLWRCHQAVSIFASSNIHTTLQKIKCLEGIPLGVERGVSMAIMHQAIMSALCKT